MSLRRLRCEKEGGEVSDEESMLDDAGIDGWIIWCELAVKEGKQANAIDAVHVLRMARAIKSLRARVAQLETERCNCIVELVSALDREKRLGDGRSLACQARASCTKHPFVFLVGWEKAPAALSPEQPPTTAASFDPLMDCPKCWNTLAEHKFYGGCAAMLPIPGSPMSNTSSSKEAR